MSDVIFLIRAKMSFRLHFFQKQVITKTLPVGLQELLFPFPGTKSYGGREI
jgi:hypothetical protein